MKETECSAWDADHSPGDWSQRQFVSATVTVLSTGSEFIERPAATESVPVHNDATLAATRARITQVLDQLAELRSSNRPEEFARVSCDSRAEVERLQKEVLDYLTRPADNAG